MIKRYLKLNRKHQTVKTRWTKHTYRYFDEIHEFKDYKLISVIKNSRAARLQPLLIYITTAGFQLNGPLVDMVEAGKDTLNGIIEDERTFIT